MRERTCDTYEQMERKVLASLGNKEILCQLAEEAAELAQAALKMRRVLDGTNPTPVQPHEAWEDIVEECSDVLVCIEILFRAEDHQESYQIRQRKVRRWLARIEEKEGGDQT